MPCSQKINDCTPCNSGTSPLLQKKKGVGLMAGIFLAVLPKCPFCVLAFSSTMILCGKGESAGYSQVHYSGTTLLLSVFFCALTMISLFLGYKDRRTWYAIGLAAAGSSGILYSVLSSGGQVLYYSGVVVMLAGVAFNMRKFRWMEKIFQLTSHIKNKQL